MRFPLRLSTSTNAGSFQRDSAGAGHSCHRFRLHDRRASSTFSGPVRRSWVAGIVSFHSHRNLQDLNLRSLPLSVKRRIPPRPRFRMPPSFRGVSSLAFGAKHVVVWLVTVFLYGLPSGVVPDFSPYIPGWLPHGGRDPPARMCGLMRSCGLCTPASAGVEEEIEEANGSAGAYAPTLPLSHTYFCSLIKLYEFAIFSMRL